MKLKHDLLFVKPGDIHPTRYAAGETVSGDAATEAKRQEEQREQAVKLVPRDTPAIAHKAMQQVAQAHKAALKEVEDAKAAALKEVEDAKAIAAAPENKAHNAAPENKTAKMPG